MRDTRRIKRMSRNKAGIPKINLTSLMDVFTILVFFLLVNSGQSELLDPPKEVELPISNVESRPRETVVVFVSPEEIVVQGEFVVSMADVLRCHLVANDKYQSAFAPARSYFRV